MFTGRKLPLTLAFVVMVGLAFGASCKGFFVDPTLTSIAVSPPSATISPGTSGNTQQFTVVATFDDGSHHSTRVTWSIDPSDGSVATLSTSGLATAVAPGKATITAASTILPNITATAALTVLLTNVTQLVVDPTSGGVTRGGGTPAIFNFTATAGGQSGIPITTDDGGILTITPSSSDVTCTVSGNSESCSADTNAVAQQYNITMTYPNSSASATAKLNVN